jgi:hypothetical protein
MSQISDILKIFPLKSRTYENGYKNYSANCFCKFKGLQLTFQVVLGGVFLDAPSALCGSLDCLQGRTRFTCNVPITLATFAMSNPTSSIYD